MINHSRCDFHGSNRNNEYDEVVTVTALSSVIDSNINNKNNTSYYLGLECWKETLLQFNHQEKYNKNGATYFLLLHFCFFF